MRLWIGVVLLGAGSAASCLGQWKGRPLEATQADAPSDLGGEATPPDAGTGPEIQGLAEYLGWTEPCRCSASPCPEDYCQVRLTLDPSCAGQVAEAEVAIAGHVEEGLVVFGSAFVACQQLEPGELGDIYALQKGGGWLWGVSGRCEPDKPVLTFTLECRAR